MVAADLLVAWFDIALDHKTLDKFMNIRINLAARRTSFLQYGPCWSYCLLELEWLVSTITAGFLRSFSDIFQEEDEDPHNDSLALPPMFIDRTAQNGMCKLITCFSTSHPSVDESMASLSCHNRVQHNTEITTGRVLHSCQELPYR